ncbi:antitoxin Xre-like helix-turn-helix domain-containing protein [Falsiroseomonas sp.]|uniref:antitoxin Xre-like helix-turn-helix domain-containing protein n=1 Tax=Falsiroseomonas sp. TaxID=2870721 RepID=UPI003565E985
MSDTPMTNRHSAAAPRQRSADHAGADLVAVKAMQRVFAAWRITTAEAARLVGVSERTWSRMRSAAWSGSLDDDQLDRASALIGIYKALHLYFGEELADRWVRMPNRGPLFGGAAPAAYMQAGGLPAILATRDYLDALRGGL